MPPDYDLDNAYDIHGPDDAKSLYDGWAQSYDVSFAEGWGYVAPREIARVFREIGGDVEPVLDIGAGTGLVGGELGGLTVDGIDISPHMLEQAGDKGIYRELILGDLTRPLAIQSGVYGGVISSGTFTHGHVGPEALPELLRITRPGALFVTGIIAPVYDEAGFGSALAGLVARGAITPVDFREIAIYEGAEHPHKDDRGLVMVFHRK